MVTHSGHLEILIFETDFGTAVCEIYLILSCNTGSVEWAWVAHEETLVDT